MAPSGSKIMRYLMIFVCFISIERVLALKSSDIAMRDDQHVLKPNSTTLERKDKSSPDASTIELEHSRTSRALPVSENRGSNSKFIEELNTLATDSNKVYPKFYLSKFSDEYRKRSSGDMIPTLRFGRSDKSMIPTLRFGRSGNSIIPTLRLGRSGNSMIPSIRFGRSDRSMIPTIRLGRSGNSMIPTIRFGRSGDSMIPTIRFGRSGDSMIPTIRVGRSGDSMIPTIRFGRSGDSMIPMIRFGRSYKNVGEEFSKRDDSYNNIEDETHEDDSLSDDDENLNSHIDDTDGDYNDFPTEDSDLNNRQSTKKRRINVFGSVIPYPRFGREEGTDSKETINNLEFINRILKRQTNDSIIPQIRYGRSSLKGKKTEELKPPFFILPNIRPGRSSSDGLNIQESTSEPYYADLDGFLGLFGAFRRSDGDAMDNSINMQEMELGSKIDDLLIETDQVNTDPSNKELDEQFVKSNKDSLFVIPYPRPGKRKFEKVETSQNEGKDQSHLHQTNKVSTYMLPYPRPGRNVENARLKRSSIPYHRPGRSNSVLPYPRLGRSNSILPYPRLGRSSSLLPYPRPGRSNSILPYPRPGRSSNVLPYPRPGRSTKEDNYMLPYPRPGRSQKGLLYENKNTEGANKIEFEYPIKELKRSKRSVEHYDLNLINPMSKEIVESMNSDFEQIAPSQGFDGNGHKSKVPEDIIDLLLKTMKDSETHNKNSYILPYPRPGRDV